MSIYGMKLHEYRMSIGEKEQEFAQRCGISLSKLRSYEKGQKNLIAPIAAQLAEALQLPRDYFTRKETTPVAGAEDASPDPALPAEEQQTSDNMAENFGVGTTEHSGQDGDQHPAEAFARDASNRANAPAKGEGTPTLQVDSPVVSEVCAVLSLLTEDGQRSVLKYAEALACAYTYRKREGKK